jgi:hypothetical protein
LLSSVSREDQLRITNWDSALSAEPVAWMGDPD